MTKKRDIGFAVGALTTLCISVACGGTAVTIGAGGSTAAAGGSASISTGSGASGGSGGSPSNSTASTGGTTAGVGGQVTTKVCPDLPPSTQWAFNCAKTVNCGMGYSCGDLDTPFDAMGCLRARCETDGDCLDIERCYRPSDFGPGCVSSNLSCNDTASNICSCIGTDDCGGAYCVPASMYPSKSEQGAD